MASKNIVELSLIIHSKKHDCCPVKAVPGPFGPHFGRLVCSRHKKHIQWLSKADFIRIAESDPLLIELDGVKERPSRRPIEREYKVQKKDGHTWNTMYSFEQ